MYMLTIRTDTYSRSNSGKSWRTHPDSSETETIPWDRRDAVGEQHGEATHRNLTAADTLAWFRRIGGSEYAERSHTPVGYIVTRLISANPTRTVRKIRTFRITDTQN